MSHKRQFKKGNVVPVYMEYKTLTDYVGDAELIEFLEEGLTFYDMKEDKPEGDMHVMYGSEKWRVKFVDSKIYPKGFEKVFHLRKIIYDGKDKDLISKYTNYQLNDKNLKQEIFNEEADKED